MAHHGGQLRVIHRIDTRCHPRAVDDRGQQRAASRSLYAGRISGCPQSTAPTTTTNSIHHLMGRRADTVKFRCEREILADALTTAGRAATSRTGTLPVLSGVRLDVSDGELTVTGTDLELTIRLSVPVHADRDGSAVVPARLVADIVKALPAGAVEVERRRRRDVDQCRSVAVLGASAVARRLSGPGRAARPSRSRWRAIRSAMRCARWCGPPRPTMPAPCSPVC